MTAKATAKPSGMNMSFFILDSTHTQEAG